MSFGGLHEAIVGGGRSVYASSPLYDWLLFLHLLAAFAMVAAMLMFWTMTIITARGPHPALAAVGRPAGILVGAGSLLTLVFGVWLAIYLDAYQVWDGWILAAIALWAVGVGAGQRAGVTFSRAADGGSQVPALRRRGIILNSVSSIALLLLLLDMILKPGV